MTDDESQTTPENTDTEAVDPGTEAAQATKSAPADRETAGPFDEAEANPVRPYIDLGAIKILPREGLNLRLEVEEQTKRIVAVGLDYADSTLQVQPFAAPRSSGLWEETRDQIRQQVKQQGGRVEEREGPLGPELLAEVPVAGADGASKRLARFVGVDGPRWFLRGVVGGAATNDVEAAAAVEDLFRSIVVVRGSSPMPPRDLIPLRMPSSPGTA
ncbi:MULTISPECIES: DUF3710 domain-containing protein [Microbacterium]|uniref:DUF3710 domain-containing protein n=1 Tax=Microbacterium testaceum TaxID=2033 RepID=A0A4Y3QJN1_MICTE|nr:MULTISPECIES: DUF3710 domain-containing protein [Microbacterium]MDZ5144028.1 DUF3710 domain-containing protein [Microbacterium testaceum]PNW08623.1 DUF3710 domain-containing protein [Microbacterium testaceum]REC96958.1 uncharacterized protein DUF3710 [Microbacterium sp. AG157]WJS92444.1 DUF3710 domain-containing protein [Microbacterium testaceum]GEB45606.1 hypothetical protein MTE01_15510 [Microbacterium testaceum]